LQKYVIFLQLVRQEVTMNEAAPRWQVDRNTISRIRVVAEEGALEALANSRPGARAKERDFELESARADAARLGEALGLSGRVPTRIDAATKAALLDLLDRATAEGWSWRLRASMISRSPASCASALPTGASPGCSTPWPVG